MTLLVHMEEWRESQEIRLTFWRVKASMYDLCLSFGNWNNCWYIEIDGVFITREKGSLLERRQKERRFFYQRVVFAWLVHQIVLPNLYLERNCAIHTEGAFKSLTLSSSLVWILEPTSVGSYKDSISYAKGLVSMPL